MGDQSWKQTASAEYNEKNNGNEKQISPDLDNSVYTILFLVNSYSLISLL